MASKVCRVCMLVIMIFNGVFFAVNIYVLGDRDAAVAMHQDLAPSASAAMATAKVLVTFAAGLLYLLAASAVILRKPAWAASGVAACILFNGLYVVELAQWGRSYPVVWAYFCLAGGLSFLIGAYSCFVWRRPWRA